MVALPKYLSAVTIDSTNKVLVVTDEGGANRSATLTEGDYYITNDGESDDLITHIEDTLTTGAGGGTWSCSLASNKFRCNCNTTDSSAWTIDWDHGSATFSPALLGVTTYASWVGVADGTNVTADHQHKNGWYGGQAVVSEPADDDKEADIVQHRAVSGRIWTYKRGSYDIRTIVHNYEAIQKAYATSGYTNQDWQSFWATINSGQRMRYYPDVTDDGTYFDCVADKSTLEGAKPVRMAPGVALYGWTVHLLGYV